MKILIEDQEYQVSDVKEILEGIMPLENKGVVRLRYVGYLYNRDISDCIFFLPKVILDADGKIFHRYMPRDIIDIEKMADDDGLTSEEKTFLYSFSVWVYQAVNVYNARNQENHIVMKKSILDLDSSINEVHVTILDTILALVRFAEENKNFLLFTVRNMHAGYNRVNWMQTISHRRPIIRQGKAPIYINPINRKKDVDYEEELLVIFFSLINCINSRYGFRCTVNPNFELIPQLQFAKYLNGYGIQRLREIKYKYFSDKALKIWKLCYSFFAMSEKINSSSSVDDFLVAIDFDRVFEAIIDDLIGQKEAEYPDYLKTQKDGKEVDHIFKYESLTDAGHEMFYIGDSKYYKTGKGVHGNSEYKQYTYAKNVIQANIDLMLQHNHGNLVRDEFIVYRDEKTEGYNITPNFFIFAQIGDDFSYFDDRIEHRPDNDTLKVHFDNRLFDRDTLMLSQYDVNFLYVITLYANSNDYSKEVYREKVRQMFREETLKRLNSRYSFYVLELKQKPQAGEERQALDAALNPIFRLINGKVLCPKSDESYTNLILALEKPEVTESYRTICQKENQKVLEAVETSFYVHKGYMIGCDIDVFLRKLKNNNK